MDAIKTNIQYGTFDSYAVWIIPWQKRVGLWKCYKTVVEKWAKNDKQPSASARSTKAFCKRMKKFSETSSFVFVTNSTEFSALGKRRKLQAITVVQTKGHKEIGNILGGLAIKPHERGWKEPSRTAYVHYILSACQEKWTSLRFRVPVAYHSRVYNGLDHRDCKITSKKFWSLFTWPSPSLPL